MATHGSWQPTAHGSLRPMATHSSWHPPAHGNPQLMAASGPRQPPAHGNPRPMATNRSKSQIFEKVATNSSKSLENQILCASGCFSKKQTTRLTAVILSPRIATSEFRKISSDFKALVATFPFQSDFEALPATRCALPKRCMEPRATHSRSLLARARTLRPEHARSWPEPAPLGPSPHLSARACSLLPSGDGNRRPGAHATRTPSRSDARRPCTLSGNKCGRQ
jgi:hypothetical protein